MTTVRIGAAPLSVDDLLAVVDGARVVLERPARDRIAAARAVVDEALAAGSAVYGLTTRVGHLRDVRLTAEEVHREQEFLVRSHAGGLGPALPVPVVRAAMVVRLAGVARGGSGASPAVADTLAAMLDAGVHPVVPETGSVGAADVAQMAWIAQVAVGLGRAEYRGEVLPGGEALRRAGIPPLVLAGKDGLALVSATGVSVGQAALVVARAARAAEAADVAAALSMGRRGPTPRSCTRPWAARRASRGRWRRPTTSATCWPAVPCWGPAARCRCRTPCPSGSSRRCTGCCASTSPPRAPRCRPSWPRRRTTRWCRVEDRVLPSNGNVHPMVLAADALRIALTHVGQLSERRMSHLCEAFFRQATGPPSTAAHGMARRYPAAAVVAELLQLAAPATLDVPPQDLGVEDHATGASLGVRKADAAVGLLEDLLAVELLLASDVPAPAATPAALGSGTAAALDLVRAAVAAAGPYPDAVHRALRARFPGPAPGGAASRPAGHGSVPTD